MKRKSFNKVLKFIFIYTPLSFILLSIFWILILKWVPVYLTPLMVTRSVQYMDNKEFKTVKRWRSIEKISDNLAMAVMASEDTRFLDHSGFDWTEIDNAVEDSKRGKRLRGASTISQQTAKNVFLFPSRSWVRKGLEAYFTIGIELIWGKKRIMEVYLNIAEMGMGIYGAEAAAQELFGKSADKLSTRESALIAAALPNPLKRRADKPSAYHNSRASAIQRMMRLIPKPEWLNKDKPKKKKVVK
jgi:monofunctional biosynthetic peptidoglycan transglycosylase